MSRGFANELQTALAAVREASLLCTAVQSAIGDGVHSKDDRSPVTVADFGSQALVCRTLREAFPEDPVIAEEDSSALRTGDGNRLLKRVAQEVAEVRMGVDNATVCSWIDHGSAREYAPRFWTLDPIDGTKGFLRGEQYAIALALVVDGEVAVAALACPNLDPGGVVFGTIKGGGTTVQPLESTSDSVPARVTGTTDPASARFVESVESGHSSHSDSARIAQELGIVLPPVRMDSQAKYAALARGDADIYLRLPARPGYVEKIWDHAAGVLVIEEAGGRVTDMHGNRLEFHHGSRLEKNRGVIATNGLLHDAVLKAVGG
ncbi:MAG: 3'(2'),5'-bisphosphate nucleotidase [Acidobacteria bacterium]|uniref:3'(2'),5'-bisphosphate nucleotidase n=1 Tax=Candidatus Polarisedimenticola svalbardensis TaxID=2886004 RepID=A0A8J6XWY5_9BACT|nr:3'(2'),5'-bisphosphate nucleotidase [Candidatus Polarisedimenticola svalbardensis]